MNSLAKHLNFLKLGSDGWTILNPWVTTVDPNKSENIHILLESCSVSHVVLLLHGNAYFVILYTSIWIDSYTCHIRCEVKNCITSSGGILTIPDSYHIK